MLSTASEFRLNQRTDALNFDDRLAYAADAVSSLTRLLVSLVTAAALLAGTGAERPLALGVQATRPQRLVAIGDLHADIANARRAFRLAGATDEQDAWIGGSLTVVQMGDLIGRGSDDRAVLDFVLDLQEKAKAGGGTLHVILGNHEVFAARPDHRWVDPGAFAAFATIPGLDLRNARVTALPAIERARFAALMPGGYYSKRLAAFPAVLKIGGTVFAHGGVLPLWARYGIDRINTEVHEWLAGRTAEPPPTLGLDDGSADDGVMWSRHFASNTGEAGCAALAESLSMLRAQRMVVAHTVQPHITPRCDERVWAVDVGISRYYGGPLEVLEIVDDRQVRVLDAK